MVSEKMPNGISFILEGNEWNKDNILLQEHPELLQIDPGDELIDEELSKAYNEEHDTQKSKNENSDHKNGKVVLIYIIYYRISTIFNYFLKIKIKIKKDGNYRQ